MQASCATAAVAPTPTGPALRRLGRLGLVSVTMLASWLLVGPTFLTIIAGNPPLVILGSTSLRATVELGGYAEAVFRLSLAFLWVAVPLAVATRGFGYASGPGRVAVGLVGALGLPAAAPLAAAGSIVVANVALWGVLLLLGALLLFLLLLRILSAPFRRW